MINKKKTTNISNYIFQFKKNKKRVDVRELKLVSLDYIYIKKKRKKPLVVFQFHCGKIKPNSVIEKYCVICEYGFTERYEKCQNACAFYTSWAVFRENVFAILLSSPP